MPGDGLDYIKMLMKNSDAADYDAKGAPDGILRKHVALAYLDVLIKRATELGCADEIRHLTLVHGVTEKMYHEDTEIPWTGWKKIFVNASLKNEVKDADPSGELLDWYTRHPQDHGCSGMDYTPPNLSQYKLKPGQGR